MRNAAIFLLLAAAFAGCAPKEQATTSTTQTSGGTVTINGAGATFPYPIYSKWFDEYHKAHPNAQINYQSIG